MRNLKKVLTLVLTLAMLLSVMVVGAGAATFGDQDSITNDEAVDMCVALNIIGGYEDGTFRPTGNVTRAEMSKMICVALNGGKEPNMGSGLIATFNDVASTDWSAPYVEYCVSQGIVGGVGGGNFNPNGNITGTQAAKMLLCILGYNASIQGYVGNDYWETNINVDAAQKGLYEGLSDIDASAPLTRDQAAQMIWNALQAYEVEYVTTLVTGPNGELTSKVSVQDRYDSGLDKKIVLLEDKYDANIKYGYMTAIDYESVKGEYTYTFAAATNFGGAAVTDDPYTGTLTTTKDFTDLFGQKVAVVYKDNNDKTVYGMYNESTVLASDIVGNVTNNNGDAVVASDTQVRINNVRYRVDTTVGATNVYTYNNSTATGNVVGLPGYYSIDAIDHNGDNKIDCFVTYPVSVGKVTYSGSSSINVDNSVGSFSYDKDDDIYRNSGVDYDFPEVSKDDWVAVDRYSVTDMARKVATLNTVQGEITAMKGTDVQIDGTWYERVMNPGDAPEVGDTVALTVIGTYYFNVETIDGQSMENVLMILEAGNNSSGISSGVEARVMYAKDGSIATISKISKVNDVSATKVDNGDYDIALQNPSDTTKDSDRYTTNGTVVIGALYTYKEKDGSVELTRLANDVIGSNKFAESTTAFVNSDTRPTVDGKVIADDAVVMVYSSGDDKYSFTTGSALKTWRDPFGDTVQYLYDTVNGVSTVTAVALYDAASIPGLSGSTGYGYVVGTTNYTKADDTDYAVMTIWTGEGTEPETVRAESLRNAADNGFEDPSAGNVSSLPAAQKGAFVTFEKLSNGNITDVKVVGTAYALTGTYVNRDGDTEIALSDNSASSAMTVTSDTKVIYVNTDDVTGATGTGNLADSLATETATDGVYVLNVVAAGTLSGGVTEADVIFVDVNNKLDGAPISLGSSATPAKINGALGSDDVTTAATTINAAVNVPAGRTLTLNGDADLATGSISVAATGTLVVNGSCTNVAAKAITGVNGATVVTGASGALATADNFYSTYSTSGSGAHAGGSTPAVSSTYVWTTWTYTDSDAAAGTPPTSMSGWVLVP